MLTFNRDDGFLIYSFIYFLIIIGVIGFDRTETVDQ